MQVRMKTEISGTRDGVPWPPRGETIDLPDAEAVELLAAKHAVPVDADEPETAAAPVVNIETAEAPAAPAETAEKPAARRGRPPKTA